MSDELVKRLYAKGRNGDPDYWDAATRIETLEAALKLGLKASNRYDYPLNRPGDTFDELMANFDQAARRALAKREKP